MAENSVTDRILEPTSPYSRLLAEAPYKARCSDNKTASLIRPRDYALRYPYMQINRKNMVSWLIFDLDHGNPMIWDDENMPRPNLVVTNRETGHAHLFYAIVPVCTSVKALSRPINYMKAVYDAMAKRMRADLAYSGPVAKTPGHPWWSTMELHNHEYELGELAEYVDLEVRPFQTGEKLDDEIVSRHCALFDELRRYAYSIVNQERRESNFNRFNEKLDRFALRRNNFRQRGFNADLRISEVRATVKSVARWTWDRYTGSGRINRGIMNLPEGLSLKDKQAMAARHAHGHRKNKTLDTIRTTVQNFKRQGLKLTITGIASACGISRQTVSKYLKALESELKNVIPLGAVFRWAEDVKNGVHQITAPCKGNDCRVATPFKTRRPFRSHKPEGLLFRPAPRPLGRVFYIVRWFLTDYGGVACYALGRSE
jgi:hypothetical protein